MPKLVTKFKYLKPSARQSRGGYARYIATREGVEKLDDSQKFAPATTSQRKLISQAGRPVRQCNRYHFISIQYGSSQ